MFVTSNTPHRESQPISQSLERRKLTETGAFVYAIERP